MRSIKLLMVFLVIGLFSCAKELEVKMDDVKPNDPNLTVISTGNFEGSRAHPSTSGKVTLSKDAAGKLFLVFENFKVDGGPDLRIYLAEDKDAKGFIELSKDVFNGNYKVSVPDGTDTVKKPYVLIWCKAFSVLFGSAKLG